MAALVLSDYLAQQTHFDSSGDSAFMIGGRRQSAELRQLTVLPKGMLLGWRMAGSRLCKYCCQETLK